MALPPDGDQHAYTWLKNRAATALDLNQEQPGVEFKRSRAWSDLWIDLTRTVLAMSNLRDGGLIVVGRPDDGSSDGITPTDLATYDPDVMLDKFAKYASPRAEVTIVQLTHLGNRYLVIEVGEFAELPVICGKSFNNDLLDGAVYVRPLTGRPRTKAISSAEEMRDLFNLATQKGMRRFHEAADAAGYVPKASDANAYDEQLGALDDV